MTDIVERLRNPSGDIFPMCQEAAAEIERLQAENEKFRTAIRVAIRAFQPFTLLPERTWHAAHGSKILPPN